MSFFVQVLCYNRIPTRGRITGRQIHRITPVGLLGFRLALLITMHCLEVTGGRDKMLDGCGIGHG